MINAYFEFFTKIKRVFAFIWNKTSVVYVLYSPAVPQLILVHFKVTVVCAIMQVQSCKLLIVIEGN